jgi:hypothetical protein
MCVYAFVLHVSMHSCMHVSYVYTHVIQMLINLYEHVCVCMHAFMYVWAHSRTYGRIHVRMDAFTYDAALDAGHAFCRCV